MTRPASRTRKRRVARKPLNFLGKCHLTKRDMLLLFSQCVKDAGASGGTETARD